LGQAKLIAATDAKDGFTGFTGAEIKKASEPVRSPTTTSTSSAMGGSNGVFATHEMVKTNLVKSKSVRGRARSDADISTTSDPTSIMKRDRFAQPFPVKQGMGAAQMKQYLPPTPPSELDLLAAREERQMIRSRSQPAASTRMSSRTDRSSGSSDYTPPPRPRLNPVRDDEEDSTIRRTKSSRATPQMSRSTSRAQSRRELFRGRRRNNDEEEGIYDFYDDYYDEKADSLAPPMPGRSATMRRSPTMVTSRSRNSSASRGGRSRNEDDDYGAYSDEDDEFEMITPKRSEITKVHTVYREMLI